MNSMAGFGVLLIAIGFGIAIPRRVRTGGSPRDVTLAGGHSFPDPKQTTGQYPSRRGQLLWALLGLGLMALGGVCIAIAS